MAMSFEAAGKGGHVELGLLSESEDLVAPIAAVVATRRQQWVKVAGGVGLLLLLAVTVGGSQFGSSSHPTYMASSSGIIGENADGCFTAGIHYLPNIPHTGRTEEASSFDCQKRCLDNANVGCAHFSSWPDGGCHLQGATATMHLCGAAVISGPPACATRIDSTPPPPEGSDFEAKCSAYPACAAVQLTEGDCCPNRDGVRLGCCDPTAPAVTTPEPTPGSECSAAPACVEADITEGACCPTTSGVMLGCCGGPVTAVTTAMPLAGTECTAFPKCIQANMTSGGCCPTNEGITLQCCNGEPDDAVDMMGR